MIIYVICKVKYIQFMYNNTPLKYKFTNIDNKNNNNKNQGTRSAKAKLALKKWQRAKNSPSQGKSLFSSTNMTSAKAENPFNKVRSVFVIEK